jgi:WD40 repeat protein
MDAADISYSPDGSCIAVADSCLCYKVLVYGLDGALLGEYSAYGDALGVRKVKWGPDGQLLAVGSYDQVSGGGGKSLPGVGVEK